MFIKRVDRITYEEVLEQIWRKENTVEESEEEDIGK